MSSYGSILIQGLGNPLRGDDSLGPEFVRQIRSTYLEFLNRNFNRIEIEWLYQLQIEQAEQWSHYGFVLIVDAHVDQAECCVLRPITSELADASLADLSAASHQVAPAAIAALAREVFGFRGEVHVLSLRAESFELGASLSATAEDSLKAGIEIGIDEARKFIESQSRNKRNLNQ